MDLDRRTFLRNSSLILGGLLLQGNRNYYPVITEKPTSVRLIRDKIGIYTEKGGTIGWYASRGYLIVIDTQFPDSAQKFMKDLNNKSYEKITYLFNTHHHRDHTSGNYFLKQFADNIIAHHNCPRLQIKQNKGTDSESKVVTANMTFNDKINIRLPDEIITATHFGQAYTGGDIVVHFENANVAHIGDLVFNKVYPYIDNPGECSVRNWITVLGDILNHFDSDTQFIFGHAANSEIVIGNKDDVIGMKNYLDALHSYVETQLDQGKSVEEISNTNTIPGFDNLAELWEGARKMNLKATAVQLNQY
jgi:glyoxylase-like metal-dependent hydrolase (beta-lactamase superfamily II)